MSPTNNKAPINIVENVPNCSLKCNFSFKYSSSKILKIRNNGVFIRINLEKMNEPPVTFNNENYNVEEINIFSPSTHTFAGKNADAEMYIIHSNDNNSSKLIICIPISVNNVVDDNSALLSRIVGEMSKRGNSIGEEFIIQEERFSLNNVIPRKPFFFYEGVLEFGHSNFIVYNTDNAIPINDKVFKQMKDMLGSLNIDVSPADDRLFYNNKGPFYNNNTPGNDDIYIDCRPTGSDGNVIIPVNDETKLDMNIFKNINSDFILQLIKVIFAGILLFFMMKAIYMLINYGDEKAEFTASSVLNPFAAFSK